MGQIVVAEVGVEEQVVSGERVVTVALQERGVTNFALGLAMLLVDVVDVVQLAPPTSPLRLMVSLDTTASRSARLGVQWQGSQLSVRISMNQLELCLAFLLRYLRDGTSDVDHIDLEEGPTPKGPTTLVLKVPRARPPISAEEARRLIGA